MARQDSTNIGSQNHIGAQCDRDAALDAVAVDFDPFVRSPDELNGAVGAAAPAISGLEHACFRFIRSAGESTNFSFRSAPVTRCDEAARHDNFARLPVRNRRAASAYYLHPPTVGGTAGSRSWRSGPQAWIDHTVNERPCFRAA